MQVYLGNQRINQAFIGSTNIDNLNNYPVLDIDYLIVGGGGAGQDGGGGAGGFISSSIKIYKGSYNVIVGAGGLASSTQNGKNSSIIFPSASIAIGGGVGGDGDNFPGNGGSGGGGGYYQEFAGSGSIGPPRQGFNGGISPGYFYVRGAGGGGANEKGEDAPISLAFPIRAGNGGNGKQWLDGNYYAGGGAGGNNWTGSAATGGLGGGGNGSTSTIAATSGQANTGGGGGGSWNGAFSLVPGNGGSGIVIIRYQGNQIATGGDTIFTSGSYTYHKFTTVGTGSFVYQ